MKSVTPLSQTKKLNTLDRRALSRMYSIADQNSTWIYNYFILLGAQIPVALVATSSKCSDSMKYVEEQRCKEVATPKLENPHGVVFGEV